MPGLLGPQQLQILSDELLGARSSEDVLRVVLAAVRQALGAESVAGGIRGSAESALWGSAESGGSLLQPLLSGLQIGDVPIVTSLQIPDVERSSVDPRISRALLNAGVKSYGVCVDSEGGTVRAWVEIAFLSHFQPLRRDQIQFVEHALVFARHAIRAGALGAQHPESTRSEVAQYDRLVDHGDLVVLRISPDFVIQSVVGDCEGLVGLSRERVIKDQSLWRRVFHPKDVRALRQRFKEVAHTGGEINEEVRIIHNTSRARRWLLIRGSALRGAGGEFIGWEALGLDVTSRREDHEIAVQQGRRLEALYQVSRSLQRVRDPALVALDGLRALISATRSEGGLGVLYDEQNKRLELVAAQGVSESYVAEVQSALSSQRTLVRLVVEQRRGELVPNIQIDPRANRALAAREGVKATILMPLLHEEQVLGVIVLFCRRARQYTQEDFELVRAATQQISVAIKDSERAEDERKEASSFAALYRLSHELSRFMSARDICEHAAPIVAAELMCKRVWIGTMNDKRSHIVGQAGAGPGMKRRIVEVQLELDLVHQFLDQAIQSHSVVIREADEPMNCSLLNRLIEPMALGTLVFAPLMSLGQVVGILVIEPSIPAQFTSQRKIPLLTSMASELAAVIVARRLEAKMADTHKMKMAGLLAAGVAHNFNNLLQAVIGQASLIEMQVARASPLHESARMIIDAAHKGAGLIKQLLTFSRHDVTSQKEIDVGRLLTESVDFYRSVVGPGIQLQVAASHEPIEVLADYGQLQQMVTNILVNAKEALASRGTGHVVLRSRIVRVRTGEVDPELAPGVYCALDIEDNGPGMNDELRRRCFEPFFTTKNVDGATGVGLGSAGLGLSSAYSLAKQHEGVIVVQSEEGKGSTFSIYLPALKRRSSKGNGVVTALRPDREEVHDKAASG